MSLQASVMVLAAACVEPLDLGRTSPVSEASRASFSAAQVESARRACALPRGQPLSYATATELKANLLGAWFLCEGPSYLTSVQFTADDRVHLLRADGRGGLEVATDDDSVSEYAIRTSPESELVVDMTRYNTGGSSTRVAFEASPRRMIHAYSVAPAVFVPLESN